MVTVGVQVLDGEYQVRCEEDQVEELRASARYLDERMRQIRTAGQIHAVDRLAILAALNIAHDNRRLQHRLDDAARGMSDLTARVDRAIAAGEGGHDGHLERDD